MWEVLSGKTPYHDVALNSVRALIVHVAHEAKRPNMDLLVQRNVSGEMRQLIEDCWHPNPEERPTAHQLYDKLVTHGSKY